MGESQHRPKRQAPLNVKVGFVVGLIAIVALAAALVATMRRPKLTEWAAAVAKNKAEGKSSAVLYYARWTLSADPKGGLLTPTVSRSLANAGFVTMEADLTDSSPDGIRELTKQGFAAVPILVLYPISGSRVAFDGGAAESEIVSTVERLSR